MTPDEISNEIVNLWSSAMEFRTNKEKITDALERVIPLLGYIPELKRRAEYEYSVACSDGVESAGGAERVRLKLAEGYAATQRAELEEIKSLEKSIHSCVSSLQSLLKEYQ